MKEKIYKLDNHTHVHIYQSVAGPAMHLYSPDIDKVSLHKTEARKLVKLLNKFVNTKEIKNAKRQKAH